MEGYREYIYSHPLEAVCVTWLICTVIVVITILYARHRLMQQKLLHKNEENYRMLADTIGQAGIEYDYFYDRLVLFGERHDAIDIPEVVDELHEKLRKREIKITLTAEELDSLLEGNEQRQTYEIDFQCGMKSGGWNWYRMIYRVVYEEHGRHRPIRLSGWLVDAQKQHQTQEKLVEIGQYDRLTEVFNRAGAESQITDALSNINQYEQSVLLLMDLDSFKQINDTCGHLGGDDVLKNIGNNMKEIFQGDTIICRWGGDEFLMLVRGPGAEEELIGKRIEELRRRMKKYRYEGKSYPIEFSIGGIVPVEGMGLGELLAQADEVLYEVKKKGKDDFIIRRKTEG